MIKKRAQGGAAGIYSACSANEYVLEAVLESGKESGTAVLIEATANQCNQYGGYTGLTPEDFMGFVRRIAYNAGFDMGMLAIGGDHLGPLTWKGEPEATAMEKAGELVRQYVLAGFSKIHLDTSMRLRGDGERLTDETIAARAAKLAVIAERAYAQRLKAHPGSPEPAYVIGSEVPIPGGTADDEGLVVTTPGQFAATYGAFESAFLDAGLREAFGRVAGIVVQPGVEFSGESVIAYDREAARALTSTLRDYGGIVFEGHSTDYQTKYKLKEMVEDGVAILKVGPALTFYLREALFALAHIEEELGIGQASDFRSILDSAMLARPGDWLGHYHGTEKELAIKRKYSLSDRCRYYLSDEAVRLGIAKLVGNINSNNVPEALISQYLPTALRRLRDAGAQYSAENLLKSRVKDCIDDYLYATMIAKTPSSRA